MDGPEQSREPAVRNEFGTPEYAHLGPGSYDAKAQSKSPCLVKMVSTGTRWEKTGYFLTSEAEDNPNLVPGGYHRPSKLLDGPAATMSDLDRVLMTDNHVHVHAEKESSRAMMDKTPEALSQAWLKRGLRMSQGARFQINLMEMGEVPESQLPGYEHLGPTTYDPPEVRDTRTQVNFGPKENAHQLDRFTNTGFSELPETANNDQIQPGRYHTPESWSTSKSFKYGPNAKSAKRVLAVSQDLHPDPIMAVARANAPVSQVDTLNDDKRQWLSPATGSTRFGEPKTNKPTPLLKLTVPRSGSPATTQVAEQCDQAASPQMSQYWSSAHGKMYVHDASTGKSSWETADAGAKKNAVTKCSKLHHRVIERPATTAALGRGTRKLRQRSAVTRPPPHSSTRAFETTAAFNSRLRNPITTETQRPRSAMSATATAITERLSSARIGSVKHDAQGVEHSFVRPGDMGTGVCFVNMDGADNRFAQTGFFQKTEGQTNNIIAPGAYTRGTPVVRPKAGRKERATPQEILDREKQVRKHKSRQVWWRQACKNTKKTLEGVI